jgi:hypothetical protein
MKPEEWETYTAKTKPYAIRIGFDLLHSEAYHDLSYGPAIKSLNFFHEKRRLRKNKRTRGKERYEVLDGNICFTYDEAQFRGLSFQQFSKALRELFDHGFIEIKKPGSALRGDYTEFALSERWREFGTPAFKKLPFPRSSKWRNFGFKKRRR